MKLYNFTVLIETEPVHCDLAVLFIQSTGSLLNIETAIMIFLSHRLRHCSYFDLQASTSYILSKLVSESDVDESMAEVARWSKMYKEEILKNLYATDGKTPDV